MTPDCPENYSPTPDQLRLLVGRIERSQRWIADRIGISERRLRYLINGTREVDGKTVAVLMTYTEQFALECLANAAEAMRRK
ncbi:MAG TPA: hypothetical protein VF783_14070 [Terriglobales bacterium]